MPKQSQLPQDATPQPTDRLTGLQIGVPQAVTYLLSTLASFFWTLANIPAGATSPITRDNESEFSFIASGLVWSPDAPGSTKNASMTAGVIYINGRRISLAAVSARTFTASDDTYVDVLDNGDGTGTLVYTLVSNNAASPALAANSTRIAIVVCGATFITNAASINQGQLAAVLPIASSIPYTVTDSLGNLIGCRDPNHRMLGYRQLTGSFAGTATSYSVVTGLIATFIPPPNRKIKVTFSATANAGAGAGNNFTFDVFDTGLAAEVGGSNLLTIPTSGFSVNSGFTAPIDAPSAGAHTYEMRYIQSGAGTLTINCAAATQPIAFIIELE
jgi:hypothetical protein